MRTLLEEAAGAAVSEGGKLAVRHGLSGFFFNGKSLHPPGLDVGLSQADLCDSWA